MCYEMGVGRFCNLEISVVWECCHQFDEKEAFFCFVFCFGKYYQENTF